MEASEREFPVARRARLKEAAEDELKIGGDPQKAVALAILVLAEAIEARTGEDVTAIIGRPS